MFCSTIIPTIGRAELSRAVNSVLEQAFTADSFEVIVVNDSGQPLPEEDWQQSVRVQVINTNRRERCVARNAGAAIAQGEYLHFLDDDDWLLPHALENFWKSTHQIHADLFYGVTQLADRQGKPIIRLHHHMAGNCFIQILAGEWIPLQSSLIRTTAFFKIGGFNPLIPGREDIDLMRRLALFGDLAEMPELVACIGMGEVNSSTDHDQASHTARWARENVLNEPFAWRRMLESANSSGWYGRIVRVYLTSMVWNLRRKRFFTAVSRMIVSLMSLGRAGHHVLTKEYWRAIVKSYESETFLRGFQQANRPVERR